jgi:peptide/nickel transport system permease protein
MARRRWRNADKPATGGAGIRDQDTTEFGRLPLLRRLFRIPQSALGVVVIAAGVFCAVFARWIVPFDPQEMDFDNLLGGISLGHPMGTDQMGRDTLSRLMLGSQVALEVSVGAVGLGMVIGVPLGPVSVYVGRWVDDAIMRVMDAVVVFPSLLVAVGLAAAMGNSLFTVILAIGIANVPWMARVTRGQALSVREMEFVAAAQAGGFSDMRVMFRHILPNCIQPVIVQATLSMGYAVLTEAALGFIGVGVQPPTPTWGNMLQEAFPLLGRQPLLSIVPGVAIFLLVLAFNLVGDALRDVLDPRLRGVPARSETG